MASDTDALQLFHSLTNITESHVVRDTRSAEARCHYEPHLCAFEFFIELYCVENFLTRKFGLQTGWQPESLKKINNCGTLIRPQASPFHRDRGRRDNSKAHCLAMEESPIIPGTLDRVANCMAKIQQGALAASVALVFCDDSGFDLDVAGNQPL